MRDVNLFSFTCQHKLQNPTCSSYEIANAAFDLFKHNYSWRNPIRGIGIRGSELVDVSAGTQLSFMLDDIRRDKWERIDAAVDYLRERYGYMSVRRAVTCSDQQLGSINPRDNHTIHPVGYFGG